MKRINKFLWITLFIISVGLIGACTPTEDDNSPLPTQPFQPVDNALVETSLPTNESAGETPVTPVILATATNSGPRPLPPTWTPLPPTPTETLAPTLDAGATWMVATSAPPATINPGCTVFNLNPSATISTVPLGQSPTLAWTAATGAVLYRVYVYNELGNMQLHEELVEGTSVVINPDVFRTQNTYVWTVAPLDAFGIQMCTELGDAITITRP